MLCHECRTIFKECSVCQQSAAASQLKTDEMKARHHLAKTGIFAYSHGQAFQYDGREKSTFMILA